VALTRNSLHNVTLREIVAKVLCRQVTDVNYVYNLLFPPCCLHVIFLKFPGYPSLVLNPLRTRTTTYTSRRRELSLRPFCIRISGCTLPTVSPRGMQRLAQLASCASSGKRPGSSRNNGICSGNISFWGRSIRFHQKGCPLANEGLCCVTGRSRDLEVARSNRNLRSQGWKMWR